MIRKDPQEVSELWFSLPKNARYSNCNKSIKEAWCLSRYMRDKEVKGEILIPESKHEIRSLEPADLHVLTTGKEEKVQVVEVSTHNEEISYPGKVHDKSWVTGSIKPYLLLSSYLERKKDKYGREKRNLNLLIYWNNRGVLLDVDEHGIPYLKEQAKGLGFKRVLLTTNRELFLLDGELL